MNNGLSFDVQESILSTSQFKISMASLQGIFCNKRRLFQSRYVHIT